MGTGRFLGVKQQAAREAVERLGLLKPQAADTVELLLADAEFMHPRAICTAYRKTGPQISDEIKKSLGIRKNGFLSEQALAELSELGLNDALRAHELTVLRAAFAVSRSRSVESGLGLRAQIGSGFIGFRYDVLQDACPSCRERDGEIVADPMTAIFAPSDCSCVTANYGIRADVDWLAGLDDENESYQSGDVRQSTPAVPTSRMGRMGLDRLASALVV